LSCTPQKHPTFLDPFHSADRCIPKPTGNEREIGGLAKHVITEQNRTSRPHHFQSTFFFESCSVTRTRPFLTKTSATRGIRFYKPARHANPMRCEGDAQNGWKINSGAPLAGASGWYPISPRMNK
jgi:hypothetical protein